MNETEALAIIEKIAKRDSDVLCRLYGFCRAWQTQLPADDWTLLEELGVVAPNMRRILPTTFVDAILVSDKVPRLAA